MPLPHCCFALAAAVVLAPASGRAAGSGSGPSPGDAGTSSSQASAVRLHGAASTVDSLVKPHAAAVEKATGLKLVIDRSNAGKGLRDLVEGKCDIALASASLEATLEAARTAGLTGATPDLRMHPISTSEVVFIVHPSNPVRKLTWEQIRDIHTGKITRWKEVGGPDVPIAVITDATASATRGLIKQVVLGGSEYLAGARAVAAVAEENPRRHRRPRPRVRRCEARHHRRDEEDRAAARLHHRRPARTEGGEGHRRLPRAGERRGPGAMIA